MHVGGAQEIVPLYIEHPQAAGWHWGLVAELPSNLVRGLSGRRDFGPRMGGYSKYSQFLGKYLYRSNIP